ncbi:MAG TPA: PVC-type heme-binding CxxCH protein [Planctomycetota bacterium]|nr:PVC-type heme-binding CxxCH protein [Planctomycetota bacterium]
MLQHFRIALTIILLFASMLCAGELSENPAELARRKLQLAPGLQVDLFAAEPDVVNPVGIWVDDRGRVFLAETRRYNTAALYVKQHSHWYFEDLACRVVDDRIAMARKFMGEAFSRLTAQSEVVKLLEDRTGSGRADRAVVFADGFNTAADGVASGVLVRGNDVWLTNVPRLWKLSDTDGDGKADQRKALQDGYGVRFGNSGHDLHGLCWGPDGKLYFSMGDRGLHIETEGKTFAYPDEGAVLRCTLDGSQFEVFARGLRNPQGLTFDDYGNLWTCDNTADVGDQARWVHVLEGGDSGWRTGYQYGTDPWVHEPIKVHQPLTLSRGSPWMTEEIWRGVPPYVLPPSDFVSKGPCGLTCYPGTGLPERYGNYFFLCDFPGGVHAFGIKPKGASYELQDVHKFVWDCWPTDAKFGPDGGLYVCDWVQGFPMTGKGRVFRAYDPSLASDAVVRETRQILKDGMAKRSVDELAALLAHRDRRVRQNAQFELATRGESAALEAAARGGKTLFARMHGIWGLGQLGRCAAVLPLLSDSNSEIRAQACRVVGDCREKDALQPLIERLKDEQPRVRLHAALALARIGRKEALAPLLGMLRENADRDGFLRHAGVTGLVGINDVDALLRAAGDSSASVRMAVLLALRRLQRDEIKLFLADADPALVVEAARAINDVPLPNVIGALAELLENPALPEGAMLRAINANFRLGTSREAQRLAAFARRKDAPPAKRAEALGALGGWMQPANRDRLVGTWRPLPPRDPKPSIEVLSPLASELLNDAADEVRIAMARTAVRLKLDSAGAPLVKLAQDSNLNAPVRIEALRAITRLQTAGFVEAVCQAVNDADAGVRREGIALFPQLHRPEAAEVLGKLALSDAPDDIRQAAVTALGQIAGEKPDQILGSLLDDFTAGRLKTTLALDVLEAARSRVALKERVAKYEASLPEDDPLAPYRVALEGGDPARGKRVFLDNAAVACIRCHRIGKDGGEVGPPLNAVGKDRTRQEIFESILLPNKVIVQGYGQETVVTNGEGIHVGRIKSETTDELVLILSDGTEKKIAKSAIRKRKPALSAMPEDLGKVLTRRDLRDLVAFLSSLK